MSKVLGLFIPDKEERRHLGRFYWASFLSEFLNVILPFQFVYLLLVLDEPSWAPIPILVESLVVFFMEIPTGVVADRWGRKISTLLGDSLSAIGWLLVPFTTMTDGATQLGVACLAFALEGLGQTLVSGAEQAWVMDNLIAKKQRGLISKYFARERSLGSLGGIFSGLTIWLVLLLLTVDVSVINALWYVSGLGQLLGVALLLKVPELRVPDGEGVDADEYGEEGLGRSRVVDAFKTIGRSKPLLALAGVMLVAAFSYSIIDDAFQISLITKNLNPRELAPLAIVSDVLGFGAPLLAVGLVHRLGAPPVLGLILVGIAATYLVFFSLPPLATVVGLFLLINFLRDMWTPVSTATLHALIPSWNRATIASVINQFSELVVTAGVGVFILMLGQHADDLRMIIPDLVEAFSGARPEQVEAPRGVFGLPIQDAALVIFGFVGALGAVLLWTLPWKSWPQVIVSDGETETDAGRDDKEDGILNAADRKLER